MQTKLKRTRDVSTRDMIVTGGEENPIPGDAGGRRRAWSICEAQHTPGPGAYTILRALMRPGDPGAPNGGSDFLTIGPVVWSVTPKLRVVSDPERFRAGRDA